MRRFNPEKELNKIKNGNKKKVIISICALLVVGVLGYSFALYQVRHTQKLVFNTVGEFKKRDIYLSVLVNGETKNEFPNQEDGYAFSGYECDGDATVTFDPDKWMASVNSNGPDKCTIKFGAKNINYDTIRKNEDVIVDETNDANLRYVGANPANYIWFNCDSYENLTNDNAEDDEHNCEKWRIIGIMNNITIVNEDTNEETNDQSLIKIIKADSIGNYAWDSNSSNDWTNASLQKYLNGNYLTSNELEDIELSSGSAINSATGNMIENILWHLGATGMYPYPPASGFYENERGSETYGDQKTIWDGKIGLFYPSDYGFATSGSNDGLSRSECLTIGLYDYQDGCKDKDWLFTGISQWPLAPLSYDPSSVLPLSNGGAMGVRSYNVKSEYSVRPSLYLKPNVKIMSGDGSENVDGEKGPYILSID